MAEELNTTLTPEVPAKEKRANPRANQTADGKPGGNRRPVRRRGQSGARSAAGSAGGHFRERRPAGGQLAAPAPQSPDNRQPRPSRQTRPEGKESGAVLLSHPGPEPRRPNPRRRPAAAAPRPAAAAASGPPKSAAAPGLRLSAQPVAADPAAQAAGGRQPREARYSRRTADRELRRQGRSRFDHQIKAEENAEDIRIDNLQIEKEIQLELAEIRTLSLD
ncbi:MAG: hypothetical protein PHR21_07285 [Oscillospiraceae bacterium]|nr:hypothetical protein [Oscillospiraceae bacterium]MDD4368301.1 hypothetical protein [Oscillospiraceae bacterium]